MEANDDNADGHDAQNNPVDDNADGHDAQDNPEISSETGLIHSVAEEDDHNDGDNEHETEVLAPVPSLTVIPDQDHNIALAGDVSLSEEATHRTHSLLPHQDPVYIGTRTSDQMVNPIGMQQHLNRNATPSSPQNTSHNLPEDPFGQQRRLSPHAAEWTSQTQTISQLLPVANQIPNLASLPNQIIAPGPVYYEPWRLQNPYQQLPVTNQIPNQAPEPNQMIIRGPVYYEPYPMANLQNTYQQYPQYPMANLQNTYQQPPPMPYLQNTYQQPPPMPYLQNAYPPRMANMRIRSDQRFRKTPPRGQPRRLAGVRNSYNPQQHNVLPEPNHQQSQQLQPQMQHPGQSQPQGSDDVVGASSDQTQDQQQPR